jgi:hypothetical protein
MGLQEQIPSSNPIPSPPAPFTGYALPNNFVAMDAQEPDTPFAAVTAQTSRIGRVRPPRPLARATKPR